MNEWRGSEQKKAVCGFFFTTLGRVFCDHHRPPAKRWNVGVASRLGRAVNVAYSELNG